MLVIHLKRFEFDYETMNRWKIKDRYVLSCLGGAVVQVHPMVSVLLTL